jgi:dsDNA-binding SOS-regulon protein
MFAKPLLFAFSVPVANVLSDSIIYWCELQLLVAPVVESVGDDMNVESSTTNELLTALRECEQHMPGFLFELTRSLMDKTGVTANLQETFLRLHASSEANDAALVVRNSLPSRDEYMALADCAQALRTVCLYSALARADNQRTNFSLFLNSKSSFIRTSKNSNVNFHSGALQHAQPNGRQAALSRNN